MRLHRSRSPAAAPARRSHDQSPQAAPAPQPQPEPGCTPELAAERRLRDAGGPEDHETYACRCGAVFPATPTTSVSCPLCGVHQAW